MFDEDLYIIGAVVVGEDNSSSNSYIYALDSAKNEYIEGDYTYWEMDAVVDGEIKTVTVKDKYGNMKADINASTGKSHPGEDCLLKVTYDKDGYVVDIEQAPSPDANTDVWYTGKANVDVTDDDGSGSDGTHVRKYPRGTLDVTSTDKLDALDVANAIRTFLNDSRIEDVDDNASTGKASQAAEDFAEFLRALHESGAEVISYADEDYTWMTI